MFQDLTLALRSFRKSPAFTAVAVLVLALGVGANTAIFSVVDAVLLRAFPYRDPDRLVMLWESHPSLGGFIGKRLPVSIKSFLAWKQQSQSFIDMAAFEDGHMNLTGRDKPERVQIATASTNFFNVLGVSMRFGRSFRTDEGVAGHNRVAILSDALLQRRFGGDPHVIGSSIALDGKDVTVVGVLPAEFHLPATWEGLDQSKPDLWTPLDTSLTQPDRVLRNQSKYVYGRLRPGVTLDQARAELKVINARMVQQDPELDPGQSANIFPLREEDVGPQLHRNVLVLQFAVAFVLLIACANIANLMLTRAAARQRELAIRIALGASRIRLIRQMLAESLLLSIAGGALGLALGLVGMRVINALAPTDIHNLHELQLDPQVLGYTLLIVLFTTVVFAVAPSLHAGSRNVGESLSQGGRAGLGGGRRLKSILVISEVALALMLLVGAGLMIRSLRALMSVNPGFRTAGLLTMQMELPASAYPKADSIKAFDRKLMDAVKGIPGVASAAIASGLPMQNLRLTSFTIEGAPEPPKGSGPTTDYQFVSENYFEVMNSRILRGRSFTSADAQEPEPHATVINESLARQYWPGQDPIGKAVLLPKDKAKRRVVIVGIVEDSHQLKLDEPTRPELYLPSSEFQSFSLVLRCTADPNTVSSPVLKQIAAIDANLPVTNVIAYDKIIRESTDERRFQMGMLTAFAALALFLASIGLYGVLAYSVAQRTREIGVRMALGARSLDVVRLVLVQGLMLALIGVGIGLVGSFWLTQLMSSVVFGVSATHPLTFAVVAAGLTIIALLASYLPARRAARIDPMEALRSD